MLFHQPCACSVWLYRCAPAPPTRTHTSTLIHPSVCLLCAFKKQDIACKTAPVHAARVLRITGFGGRKKCTPAAAAMAITSLLDADPHLSGKEVRTCAGDTYPSDSDAFWCFAFLLPWLLNPHPHILMGMLCRNGMVLWLLLCFCLVIEQVMLVDNAGLRSHSLVGDVFLELQNHRAALRAWSILHNARLPELAVRGPRPEEGPKAGAGSNGESAGDDTGGSKDRVRGGIVLGSVDRLHVNWASPEEWQAARATFVPRFF